MPSECECGCGGPTNLNPKTGQPRRFIKGHHHRRTPRPDGMKRCNGPCGLDKPLKDFSPDRRSADGASTRCKMCKSASGREIYYDATKDYRRQTLRKYGLTWSEYEDLFRAQGGKCAICRSSSVRRKNGIHLIVDHCHKTNRVRGLLCHSCNAGLGMFKDNPLRLFSAAKYLQKEE